MAPASISTISRCHDTRRVTNVSALKACNVYKMCIILPVFSCVARPPQQLAIHLPICGPMEFSFRGWRGADEDALGVGTRACRTGKLATYWLQGFKLKAHQLSVVRLDVRCAVVVLIESLVPMSCPPVALFFWIWVLETCLIFKARRWRSERSLGRGRRQLNTLHLKYRCISR